jgi:transposase
LLRQRTGHPRKHSPRELLDAMLYLLRTGCPWPVAPRLPAVDDGMHVFPQATAHRPLASLNDQLQERVREQAGRQPYPSRVIVDRQSVKTMEKGGHAALREGSW